MTHAISAADLLEWIERQVATAEYTEEVRIVNTGLILYRQPLCARRLTDEVYAICWKLAQPECQIVWAALAQRYINMIAQIPWEQVEPVWKERPVVTTNSSTTESLRMAN